MAYLHAAKFEQKLAQVAPYMASTFEKRRAEFGAEWERQLDETVRCIFADDDARIESAVRGYVRFAIDATKLQKRFEKERRYIPKSYSEAASAVYHNEDYMFGLYLPGILLSHYLWPHHYRQLNYFKARFLPRLLAHEERRFCDVGVGTGFYSRQILTAANDIHGVGFDISRHALRFAEQHVAAFGLSQRWEAVVRDVVGEESPRKWPFLVSVEVLEHLEDPVTFLKALKKMLDPEGLAFITAAITAPNADHIYLYNNVQEVIDQLHQAGFTLVEYFEDVAYPPKRDEPVPTLGAFIVN